MVLLSFDYMVSMVGSYFCVLYFSVKGWEGIEVRMCWVGCGVIGNLFWIREIRVLFFNSCVLCRYNFGLFFFFCDLEWVSYF